MNERISDEEFKRLGAYSRYDEMDSFRVYSEAFRARLAESAAVEELETFRHSLTISVRSKLLLQEAELKVMRLALSMACEDAFSSSSAMAAYEARARAALTKGAL